MQVSGEVRLVYLYFVSKYSLQQMSQYLDTHRQHKCRQTNAVRHQTYENTETKDKIQNISSYVICAMLLQGVYLSKTTGDNFF